MLGLKMPTDERWARMAEGNLEELLTDHAYCEQKAASNAISLIVNYPEYPEMVDEMVKISREEMEHFGLVHQKIRERGYNLGKERKDPYVHDLMKFLKKDGSREQVLVDRLLFAAMIEARSCERFKLLSEKVNDSDLRKFYYDLMVSEANHYRVFLNFARKYGKNIDVETRWKEFLEYEASVINNYSKKETMHG
ncbi:MAG: tRNA-(ms[2]io[6]A)-hydroxylase [Flavobacteriales bacterium]